jgi:hypothetical protein
MQFHGAIKVVDGITVTTFGSTGSIALGLSDGSLLILEDATDDVKLISALAEVRRLRAIDAALQPPARYEMPLRLVGGEA